jgi:hypothetical protein
MQYASHGNDGFCKRERVYSRDNQACGDGEQASNPLPEVRVWGCVWAEMWEGDWIKLQLLSS